jgi:hypothetical protein
MEFLNKRELVFVSEEGERKITFKEGDCGHVHILENLENGEDINIVTLSKSEVMGFVCFFYNGLKEALHLNEDIA